MKRSIIGLIALLGSAQHCYEPYFERGGMYLPKYLCQEYLEI